MKVLFVSKEFLPKIGGIQRVTSDLCRGLEKRNVKARVLTQTKSLHSNAVPCSSRNPLDLTLKILREKPDVVHVHGFRNTGFFAWLGARLAGKPIVVTPHWDYSLGSLKQRFNVWLHKTLGFNALIALTNAEKKLLKEKGFKRVKVIPNPVDLEEFSLVPAKKNRFIKTYGIKENDFVVLFAGRLAANKGIPFLIEAFSRIKAENKRLFLVGPEDRRFSDTTFGFFKKTAKRFNTENEVTLAGELAEADLVEAFSACNVLVLPSIASEAFGLVLVQAMALEKPVIASRLGGIPEVVNENCNGLLVEPGNAEQLAAALQKLFGDSKLRKRLGEEGKRNVFQKYALERIVSRHIELYRNLIP